MVVIQSFPFWMDYFQVQAVSFRECNHTRELTYPPISWHFESMISKLPKVGYVNSLEGNSTSPLKKIPIPYPLANGGVASPSFIHPPASQQKGH